MIGGFRKAVNCHFKILYSLILIILYFIIYLNIEDWRWRNEKEVIIDNLSISVAELYRHEMYGEQSVRSYCADRECLRSYWLTAVEAADVEDIELQYRHRKIR